MYCSALVLKRLGSDLSQVRSVCTVHRINHTDDIYKLQLSSTISAADELDSLAHQVQVQIQTSVFPVEPQSPLSAADHPSTTVNCVREMT